MVSAPDIVTIIGALGVLVTTIFTAWAAFRAKTTSEGVRDENVVQTKKLDNITILVDGRYGEVLQELADMKRLFAISTGDAGDAVKAAIAQEMATEQHGRTASATRAIADGGGVKLPDSKS